MTTRQQSFAEAFGELVARAVVEPFVPLTSIGALAGASTAPEVDAY